jgi:glycerol-3-phosphate dehydrogenase
MERLDLHQICNSRSHLADDGSFDITVVGGGIHGAQVARDARLRGYNVLLLEANDFAYGTSSRSSKLLHGGVRYLEQGDVLLVYHALIERARSLALAPHLSRIQPLHYPIVSGMTKPAWQVKIGLIIYDTLARCCVGDTGNLSLPQLPWHSQLSEDSEEYKRLLSWGIASRSIFEFCDGQMDDTRWVIEAIVDASELGAVCLNSSRLSRARFDPESVSHPWLLEWTDALDGRKHKCRTSYLINTTGPWVPSLHEDVIESPQHTWDSSWPKAVFSRGTHLLFEKSWPYPGLVLPTGEAGRVYFVLPYYSPSGDSVIVGTTDRRTEENENNPQASDDEIAELLAYLERDLPNAGLNKDSLKSSFAGMRVLADVSAANIRRKVSSLSRQEKLLKAPAYLALLGGKYTTSRRTAEKICDLADSHFGNSKKNKDAQSTRDRLLPGSRKWSLETEKELLNVGMRRFAGDQDPNVARELRCCVRRFGVRSEEILFPERSAGEKELGDLRLLLERQATYCMKKEFARSESDLIRRLGLDDGSEEARIFLNYIGGLRLLGLPSGC